MDLTAKHAYLRDCYSKTYDELVFRVQHRDSWIKLQLITQLVLAAVAIGLKLQIVDGSRPLPNALSFCLPASLIIFLAFRIEEREIIVISRYLATLSEIEEKLNPGFFVPNFDSSVSLSEFFSKSQTFRLWSQLLVFFFIPLSLWTYRAQTIYAEPWFVIEAVLSIGIALVIFANVILAYVERKRNAKKAEGLKADHNSVTEPHKSSGSEASSAATGSDA